MQQTNQISIHLVINTMGDVSGTRIPRLPAERTGSVIVHPEVRHASPLIADNTVTAAQKYSHCWPVITYGALRKHHFVFKAAESFHPSWQSSVQAA